MKVYCLHTHDIHIVGKHTCMYMCTCVFTNNMYTYTYMYDSYMYVYVYMCVYQQYVCHVYVNNIHSYLLRMNYTYEGPSSDLHLHLHLHNHIKYTTK